MVITKKLNESNTQRNLNMRINIEKFDSIWTYWASFSTF